ncbi:alkaline phosphatase D family protein [Streptomyces sp. NPDC059740]|uniref:alkaline phosphatase D family protein n=1 Tax=Streptomyces sp. NPDC059740 TaxID=3346926 RepID=UPI003648F15E
MGQRLGAGVGRRSVLRGTAAAALTVPVLGTAAPAQARSGRPRAAWGVQSGDVSTTSGLVWVRADRPARMTVQTAATESFRNPRTWHGPLLGPESDLTGVTSLTGLPPGEQIHYRVVLSDPDDPRRTGEPVTGTFRTAPDRRRGRDVLRMHWSGDLAGQGFGINPDIGGYRVFEAMRRRDPDFFLMNGDHIYADNPVPETVALPDGRVWRNVTTPEKAHVAQTLADYRGAFRYNLLDANLLRFNAQLPTVTQWDDHEVHNNWYPGEILDEAAYTEKRVDVLAARARRAFAEYFPIRTLRRDGSGRVYRVVRYGPLLDVFVLDMRTYRDANSPDRQTSDPRGILGEEQLRWLKKELARSRATWKVIASDMPLGLVVADGDSDFEAVSQGDPGQPLGRELQIADLLRFVKHRRVTGTVWLTTDVHYTAAQHFDPSRAAFADFEPFWQFVSGPLNAGGFPATALDATFGCEQRFLAAPSRSNVSPMEAPQYFGEIDVAAASGEMTVRLRADDGRVLFTKVLQPGLVGQPA